MLGIILVIIILIFAITTVMVFIGANKCKTNEEKEQEDYEQMKYLSNLDKHK